MPIDVVVAGAAGRMGSRIVACLREVPELRLVAALEAPGHRALGSDAGEVAGVGRLGVAVGADPGVAIARDRVLVEFSVPEASVEHLRAVARAGARAVIGTTGFSPDHNREIADLAKHAAILVAPSMSVAVNVAFSLLATMAKTLGDDYDVEITETHHRFKKDAPTGTALRIAAVHAATFGRAGGGGGRRVQAPALRPLPPRAPPLPDHADGPARARGAVEDRRGRPQLPRPRQGDAPSPSRRAADLPEADDRDRRARRPDRLPAPEPARGPRGGARGRHEAPVPHPPALARPRVRARLHLPQRRDGAGPPAAGRHAFAAQGVRHLLPARTVPRDRHRPGC